MESVGGFRSKVFADSKGHAGEEGRKPSMKFSDQFEQRFAEMLTHYPTRRSVLVPTLLYAQDEVGFLSPEAIAEIAQRLELTELEVNNVISYYSMLTTKPRGKYNVQVCTNIACMLRGGEELLDALQEEAWHRTQRNHPGRAVFSRGSGVYRRLQLGAGGAGQLRLSREPDHRADGPATRGVQEERNAVTTESGPAVKALHAKTTRSRN